MTINDTGRMVRRWWWLLVLLPLVGLIGGFVLTRDQPYETSFRATILIPGDTEIPGRAERPELMVMDDAPALIDSRAFAEMTWEALTPVEQSVVTVDDVQQALSASRYSRVLTISSTSDAPQRAEAIAAAAAVVLPNAINQYLVANSAADPATVQVIDPPGTAVQDSGQRWLDIAVRAGAALVFAIVLALLLDSVFPERREPDASAPDQVLLK